MVSISESTVDANGISFGVLEAGSGPLALCLHGFPDSAWTWRHLLPRLAEAGFHAVAPFMRGYAPTEVPSDGRYQTAALSLDANELHDTLGGGDDAVIIGHDWGAMAAYGAANSAPEKWSRVVTAAVPPAGSMGAGFLQYAQLRRSWYMFFFQSPMADIVVPMNDLEFIDHLWADWSPGYDATDDLPRVKACLSDPANLAAALGYYRATLGDGLKDPDLDDLQSASAQPTVQPTLYLHGADDGCAGVDLAQTAGAFLPHDESRVETLEAAGHFLHLERPDLVNDLIVEFVKAR